jgi:ribosomal protein S18 acetylase RimI-like enzyme
MICEYSINQSNLFQVISHLDQCSELFVPTLSSYIDICSYSEKLIRKATRIEAFDEIKLIGLIAVYINEDENLCFVSNVSVIPGFSGKGIATTLFYRTQNLIKNLRVNTMILHVDKNNYPAINFYEKLGFQHDLIFDNKIKMILYLK